LDKAYQISEKAYGKNHPAVAKILVNVARLRINQDNREQAETILTKALEIQDSLGERVCLDCDVPLPRLEQKAWS